MSIQIKHEVTLHFALEYIGKLLRLYTNKHQQYLVEGTDILKEESEELKELFVFLNKEVLGDAMHSDSLLEMANHFARYGTPWNVEPTNNDTPFSFRPLKELLDENMEENNKNQ